MSTQTGTFFLGTYGFAIAVNLHADLTGATAVNLTLKKPDGASVTRNLTAAAITDMTNGVVTYLPEQAEVNLPGVYTFEIAVPIGGSKQLTTDAQFYITPTLDEIIALVLEDGSGLANSNSYASVAEFDDYYAKRLHSEDAKGMTVAEKKSGLIMATRMLEASFYWNGVRKNIVPGEQALGWPRVPTLGESRWGSPIPVAPIDSFLTVLSWPYDQVPLQVKYATIELAVELKRADRTLEDSAKGIRSVSLGQGAISVDFDSEDRKQQITDPIVQMLQPYGSLVGKKPSSINVVR